MRALYQSIYFQVKIGCVILTNNQQEGKEFIHSLHHSGECVGETFLFSDRLYAASAVAVFKCTMIRLERNKFHKLLTCDPAIT